MGIELRKVTAENFDECVSLSVADDQDGFVATNLMSIAQSKVYPTLRIRTVYDGEEMVGFVMFGLDPDDNRHYLVRLMVDKAKQGRGYGRKATRKVIEEMRSDQACDELFLSCVPANKGAIGLYESLGFERTGEIDEQSGEIIMRLGL